MSEKLGDLLVRDKVIRNEQLVEALKRQHVEGGTLGENLLATKAIESIDDLAWYFAEQLNTKVVNLEEMSVGEDVIELVPHEIAVRYNVLPLEREEKVLHIVLDDPRNVSAGDAIKFITGYSVKIWVATTSQLKASLDRYYISHVNQGEMTDILQDVEEEVVELVEEDDEAEEGADFLSQVSEAPLVRLVNKLIVDAIKMKASDIHIEIYETLCRVRYRIDGTLIEQTPLPYKLKNAIVSRLKIMASLDISERRLPQDGRIKMSIGRKVIDLRVNTLPTVFGEKVVMRILDPDNLKLSIDKLGFLPKAKREFEESLRSPYGMILVTGPTGSGKTTTLYTALSTVNGPGVNIMTAEDPVEYNLEGINQVQVKSDIGLTFASALRAFLRQDPDIILVGEIRDLETAQIGVKAALTGHLVLSTLHTNDAPSTISRLGDMGIEPFLIASSVRMIVAQRLLRTLCSNCKTPLTEPPKEWLDVLGLPEKEFDGCTFYQPNGCPQCANTGFRGRVAVHQVMPIDNTLKNLILDRGTPSEIEEASVANGVMTLRMSALEILKKGLTTPEEVFKTTSG